jgi:hypothetical protein
MDRSRLAEQNRKQVAETRKLIAEQKAMLRQMVVVAQHVPEMADVCEEYRKALEELGHPLARHQGEWTLLRSDEPNP